MPFAYEGRSDAFSIVSFATISLPTHTNLLSFPYICRIQKRRHEYVNAAADSGDPTGNEVRNFLYASLPR